MNLAEKKMADLLTLMKEEYHLTGVKGEFEAEGAQLEELMRLKEIATRAGVGMAIKIGGCEAISDMRMACSLGAEQIVAPMIESPYALKKFVGAAKAVFSGEQLENMELLINVETSLGANHIDAMVNLPEAAELAGLDIGRIDLSGSMGLASSESNNGQVFDTCRDMCEKWAGAFPEKACTLGGYLTEGTIAFLTKISRHVKVGCESKKTIFSHEAVSKRLLRDAYLAAIKFEKLWYDNCMERYRILSNENWGYFKALDSYADALEALTV
jgi:hypothetical protein